jgi:hypothetical protein
LDESQNVRGTRATARVTEIERGIPSLKNEKPRPLARVSKFFRLGILS